MNRSALFTGLEAFPLTVQELSFSNGWETNQPPHLKKVDLLEIKPIKKRTPLMNDVNSIQTRNMVLPCFSITEINYWSIFTFIFVIVFTNRSYFF